MCWQNETIDKIMSQPHACACGQLHKTTIKEVDIGHQIVDKIPQDLDKWGYQSPFIISDNMTEDLLGAILKRHLKNSKKSFSEHIFKRSNALVPDEKALGELLIAIPQKADLIIGVGSGTINDLCRFISYKMEIPYWMIGTAPSMDGYASTASPLIVDHLKMTYYCGEPERILGELEILAQAPMIMISAGVGDLLGKYTALTDWRIGQMITGEYYCEAIVELVENAVEKCIKAIDALLERDLGAIKSLMEALILSGIAMSYTGNSRPASGSEHHLSHFWEMKNILRGIENPLHGTKVGVSTLVIIQMYQGLLEIVPDFDDARNKAKQWDQTKKEAEILEAFEAAGPAILKEQKPLSALDRIKRIDQIEKEWPAIQALILKQQEHFNKCEPILKKLNAPTKTEELQLSKVRVEEAINFAKEIRPRYTVLQLYEDIGLRI